MVFSPCRRRSSSTAASLKPVGALWSAISTASDAAAQLLSSVGFGRALGLRRGTAS